MKMNSGLVTLVAALSTAGGVAAQPTNASRVERAMSQLTPALQVEGRTYVPEGIASRMSAENVPGVSIVFIDQGRIAWTGTFGAADAKTSRQVTLGTRFQAASISKPIAATGALLMAEQGRLALDRPVNEQISSWRLPDSAFPAGAVTVRHLLTHTAGLTVHGFPGYAADAPLPSTVQILEGAKPANTAPVVVAVAAGTKWQYSGGGFTLLQLLMSDVAGEPFPDLMQRLLLRPLGMEHSSFDQPLGEEDHRQAAFGHRSDGSPIEGGYVVHPELAAAGLWTTPTDLARWIMGITSAFAGEKNGPLSSASATAMLTPGIGQWGLGMRVDGEGEWLSFSHGGSNQGFRTFLLAFPRKGQGLVIMTNGDNGESVMQPVRQAIGREFGWPNSEPGKIPQVEVARTLLEETAGRYAANGLEVEVMLKGDQLIALVPPGNSALELVPQGDDRYVTLPQGMKVEFLRESGVITSLAAAGLKLERQR